jgi:hypothetical protein
MDRSLFLARLMGPTFVAIALGMLINLGMYESMIAEALHTGIVFYLSGLLSLLAGLAIVNTRGPAATHAPHQAPKALIEQFKGKFDMGWDAYRRQTFERQKEMGIVPLSAELTERPKSLPACGGPATEHETSLSDVRLSATVGAVADIVRQDRSGPIYECTA